MEIKTLKCARRTCKHVHLESERHWVRQIKRGNREYSACPKCSHIAYFIVEPKPNASKA